MARIEFESNLGKVLNATEKQFAMAAEIIGGKAESYAKIECPAVTGNLRNSITHSVEDNGHTVVIGSAVQYAPFVELGTGIYAEGGGGRQTPWRYQDRKGNWYTTSGSNPHPFLRPAMENHLEEYKSILERIMSK